jgi:hypothetical protein
VASGAAARARPLGVLTLTVSANPAFVRISRTTSMRFKLLTDHSQTMQSQVHIWLCAL